MDMKNDDLNYCPDLEQYVEENADFFKNAVVKAFLKSSENKELLIKAICEKNERNAALIDEEFKRFYFNIRFSSFISNILHFNSVNYDKKHRKLTQRFPLIIDKPVGDPGDVTTLKDLIKDMHADIDDDNVIKSSNIEDYIVDSAFLAGVKSLTSKQKQVIDFAYVDGLTDTEIGERLGKSQQAVSKLHKTALKKIYRVVTRRGGS